MKKITKSRFCNEPPPNERGGFFDSKKVLAVLAFLLAFLCFSEVQAARQWGSDCFTATYKPLYGRYELTVLIHEANRRGDWFTTDEHGKLDGAMIKVHDTSDGSYKDLLYINADGGNSGYYSRNFRFEFKNPQGGGKMYDTQGSRGSVIESEITGINKSIGFYYDNHGTTYKVFYWYPSSYYIERNLKFIMSYGYWNQKTGSSSDNIVNQWSEGEKILIMTNSSSNLSIVTNTYDSKGNNIIEYSLDSYNASYEKGTCILEYSEDNGTKWAEKARRPIDGKNGTFIGQYIPVKKESFIGSLSGHFRVVKKVNISDNKVEDVIFERISAAKQAPRKAVFTNFSTEQNDNKIHISWETTGVNDNSHINNSYEIYIRKNRNSSWDDAVKIKNISYSTKDYTYEIPTSDLGVDKERATYEFMLKRSELDTSLPPNFGNLFTKTQSLNVNPNYKTIIAPTFEPDGNSIVLKWNLSDGIFLKDDFEYVINIPGEGEFYPQLKEGVNSHLIGGLKSCHSYNITLSLRLKSTKTIISSHTYNGVMIEDSTPSIVENFTASKGYFTNKVNLRWEVPRDANNFERFVITRKIIGSDEDVIISEISHDNKKTIYNYEDNSVDPGIYYDYSLNGYVKRNKQNIHIRI